MEEMRVKEVVRVLRKKWLAGVLGVGLLVSLLANAYFWKKGMIWQDGTEVLGVLDGDTLVLEGKVRLRLRHADAPELEFCGGKEAKALLKELVEGERVRVRERVLDQRGRPLALIYVDDTLVNKEMVESGWARYHHDTSDMEEILKAAGQRARKEELGVYNRRCRQQEKNLENPECNIKGNIDNTDSSIKRYYIPGCVHYKTTIIEKDIGEQWFCSEKEAREAGYVKGGRCP